MDTTTRNATLGDFAELLQQNAARRIDVVAPATAITSRDGVLLVSGTEAELTDDGVTTMDGRYRPTAVADEGLAQRLGIPVGYLKRLRADRPDLYDANVNGLLHGSPGPGWPPLPQLYPADSRKYLVRAYRGDDGGEGIARAVLSDSYRMIDNLDVLVATLDGVRAAGATVEVKRCDLTERRMYVKVEAPDVAVMAPALLRGYRSPFTGATGADNPLVHAGFRIVNSEVGCGAFQIVPEVTVQVCDNGMTITKDAMRAVHLGGKLDEGVIRWSADTQQKMLATVSAQARDAVAAFLDAGYVQRLIDSIEGKAAQQLANPAAAVEHVSKAMGYSAEQTAGVLDHFIRAGDTSCGGILGAVTSWAQTIEDADVAWEFGSTGLAALDAAAVPALVRF